LADLSHATDAAWRQRSGTKAMNEGDAMTDADFGQSNIEGAMVATWIEAHHLPDGRRSRRLRHGAHMSAAAPTAGLGLGLFALEGVRR
jgi:hypothetical protein